MRPFAFESCNLSLAQFSPFLLLIFLIKFIEHLLHGYPAVTRNQKEYRNDITRRLLSARSLLFAVRNL
jgi:hypothetical protein